MNDRHVLTDQQLNHALNLAAPFLHALAPTEATATVLRAYSDKRVRLERTPRRDHHAGTMRNAASRTPSRTTIAKITPFDASSATRVPMSAVRCATRDATTPPPDHGVTARRPIYRAATQFRLTRGEHFVRRAPLRVPAAAGYRART